MRIGVGMATAGLVLAAAACGDSGPSMDSFVGTWNATKAEFVSEADATVNADIIALGATFQITFNADSTWRAILTFSALVPAGGQVAPDTSSGTWTSSIDVLTLVTTGQSGNTQFNFVLSGNTLTLTGGHMTWDFGTGDEPAILNVTAVKQ
jgi:Lipocalin-like domain